MGNHHRHDHGRDNVADFADRSLGIGYAGGTSILLTLLLASLFFWYRTLGTVAVDTVSSPKSEVFYWVTIMFSQTLGTALGDWTADSEGLGYGGGIVVFGTLLGVIAAAYYWTKISHTVLFWAAFILTRPLGAVVGDFLDKPVNDGGLALSRYSASAALIVLRCASFCSFHISRPGVHIDPETTKLTNYPKQNETHPRPTLSVLRRPLRRST